MNIRMAAVGGSEVQLDNPSSMQSFLNQVSKANLNMSEMRSAIVHGRQAALDKLDQQLSELEGIAVDLLKSLLTTHAFVLETKLENRIELLALE